MDITTTHPQEGTTVIDSDTQTKAIEILADYLGEALGTTARKDILAAAPGPHQPTDKLFLSYTGDFGWAFSDSLQRTTLATKLAEIGLAVEQADGAIDAVVITPKVEANYIWLLTAEVTVEETGHYDGITVPFTNREAALRAFERFLIDNDLDSGAAHYGETSDNRFIGNDPDPDTFEDGAVIHWGINRLQVRN